jgi:hypothetical protein
MIYSTTLIVEMFIELNANCTNLWLGYNYCVAPFPPLQSSSVAPIITTNYSTATLMTIPLNTASYTPTLITVSLTPAGIPAPTNVADGTRTIACGYYYDVQVCRDLLFGSLMAHALT